MYNFLAEIVRFLIMYIINIYCTDPCEQVADFRAQQCQHLFEVVSMDILAVDLQLEQVIMYVCTQFIITHFHLPTSFI